MNRFPIFLDTDPGLDDAIALLLLSAYAKEQLDTIISSYGNVSLEHTTTNLLRCCALFDIEPYIIKGSSHPMKTKTFEDAAHIHGADGFANLHINAAALPVAEKDPIEDIYQRICKLGQVNYITIGPMTNLALLITKHPDVVQHLHQVVSMGGAFEMGNVRPYAEFNIFCDPWAAKIVLETNWANPLLLVPLNTTHQIALNEDEIYHMTRTRSVKSGCIQRLLLKNLQTNMEQGDPGCIVHDASAVLAFLFPDCFTYRFGTIEAVVEGTRAGETLLRAGAKHRITDLANRDRVVQLLDEAIQ